MDRHPLVLITTEDWQILYVDGIYCTAGHQISISKLLNIIAKLSKPITKTIYVYNPEADEDYEAYESPTHDKVFLRTPKKLSDIQGYLDSQFFDRYD